MKQAKSVVLAMLVAGMVFLVNSCNKESEDLPNEPIFLVEPDSSVIRRFAGDVVPVEVKFTTDRPINWMKGMYDVDTLGLSGYTATYPDTLFFLKIDTIEPRVNLYTYSGTYTIPDTLPAFSIVRFRVSFEAGKNSFETGQNYPQGKVSATKEFRIDVR